MKNIVLKILTVVSGSMLSIIKLNGFDIWSLPNTYFYIVLLVSLIVFLGSILLLNIGFKKVLNFSNVFEMKKNELKPDNLMKLLTSRKKYYIISVLTSMLISFYLGVKFKIPDSGLMYKLKSKSITVRDSKIEYYRSRDSYLGFEYFDFNWEIFSICLIILTLIIVFVGKTNYYDKLMEYLKKIKRD